ncbi:hypothetical protein O181_105144 [Austropuccinia psidii MF-1]|uniref:Uncharacterized protein n=1 Tax=Austropuccinia psidii MF-1 TaxID=1389203 RepID=A0A9Q3PKU3_9BASI|nr:hypothetical protein [Austropuccinia psidii MF-1]
MVAARGHGWKYGPWWSRAKVGSYGIYGQNSVQQVFGQFWVQGIGGQFGSGGQLWFRTHLALSARWLPPLSPFGLNRLGQKGPNWPADCGMWPMDRGPRAVGAIGGQNGPKRPFRPKPP